MVTTTKERPILFAGQFVRAILEGRKGQTRRPIFGAENPDHHMPWRVSGTHWQDGDDRLTCPFGEAGDRLWVRETWQAVHWYMDPETGHCEEVVHAERIPKHSGDDACYDGYWTPVYAATDAMAKDHREDRGYPYRPAIHMPRWASRITLEVAKVRVERVQAISNRDCLAEGLHPIGPEHAPGILRDEYAEAWESMYGPRGAGWELNPWVWVVEFRRLSPA